MSSNMFFSPLPRAQPQSKRASGATTTFSQDTSWTSNEHSPPFTPPRKPGSKTPFGFKSPTPVLFASPSCFSSQERSALFFSWASNKQSPPFTPPCQIGSKTPFGFKSPKPVLFASPSQQQSLPFSPRSRKGKQDGVETPLHSDLGYFAFPPGSPPSLGASHSNNATDRVVNGVSSAHNPTKPPCTPPKSRASNGSATTHQQRTSPSRVLEQAEAERGEEEWVSRGGVLRDRFGNVDVARTKRVKDEVERKVREKVLRERWEAYEAGWRKLVERCGGPGNKGKAKAKDNEEGCKDISFNDIPWPIWVEDCKEEKPRFTSMSMSINGTSSRSQASLISGKNKDNYTLQDLTIDQIEDFLISPLSIRGSTETPKNRVRRSYLRWHPDKLGWLIDRLKDEDADDVKAGVGTVLESLRRMNAKFRAPADSELLRSQAGTPGSSCSASGSSPPAE